MITGKEKKKTVQGRKIENANKELLEMQTAELERKKLRQPSKQHELRNALKLFKPDKSDQAV